MVVEVEAYKQKWIGQNTIKFLVETCCPFDRKLDIGRRFTFKHDNCLKHRAKPHTVADREKGHAFVWLRQSPDFYLDENLRNYLKNAVHQCLTSILTKLEQFCREEWASFAQFRSTKLVEAYSDRLKAVIKVKGGSILLKTFFSVLLFFPNRYNIVI